MKYCKDNDILKEYVVSRSLEQNDASKRKIRTIIECAKSMLKENNLPNNMWVEDVNIFIYLLNRIPT